MRLTPFCTSAARFPTTSENTAITASARVQTYASPGNAVTRMRSITTSATVFVAAARDPRKVDRPGGAVDERRPEEQHGRAEPTDDQVLERRLQTAQPVAVDRAEDVQADRKPFQGQEQRQQVVRTDEE